MLTLAMQLKALGVLGINARNADYTLAHNPRCLYPLVDDKFQTKQMALKAGIPVPELYGVVEREVQVRGMHSILEQPEGFVIKPAHGSGGDGVVVIAGLHRGRYRTITGNFYTPAELDHHVYNVLSGLYSLAGQPDQALIEYRVQFDPIFDEVSYKGVPDIRVVVFLGVPVMAMVRLPTRMSEGKANLHLGGLGAGIDLAIGTTLAAVCRNEMVEEHPDTGAGISGLSIPQWETILAMAAACCDLSGLGYLGVDIVLDKFRGPLLLELNARPGLGIQIANGQGLLPRLHLVEQHRPALTSREERIAFAREHFGVKADAAG
jgi:alpha-L-glutamate ligase-like protein